MLISELTPVSSKTRFVPFAHLTMAKHAPLTAQETKIRFGSDPVRVRRYSGKEWFS